MPWRSHVRPCGSGTDPENWQADVLPHRMTRLLPIWWRGIWRSFAAALEKVPLGDWAGPIDSSFGAHYVRVSIARRRWRRNSPPCATRSCANGRTTPPARAQRRLHEDARRISGQHRDGAGDGTAMRTVSLPLVVVALLLTAMVPGSRGRVQAGLPAAHAAGPGNVRRPLEDPGDRRVHHAQGEAAVPRRDRGPDAGAQHLFARASRCSAGASVCRTGSTGRPSSSRSSRKPGSTCSRGSCAWTAPCSSSASCRCAPASSAGPALARLEVVRTYTILGIEHILSGFDHLLFVLALVLLVQGGAATARHHHGVHGGAQPDACRGNARLGACPGAPGRSVDCAEHSSSSRRRSSTRGKAATA